jgi:cupin 2 domain-containing protein
MPSHICTALTRTSQSIPVPAGLARLLISSYGAAVINLFDDLPRQADEELFTELLWRKGVRIERIVSTGQSTPVDKPYNQEYDEWVLLVSGSAGLWIEGEGERELRPGDYVLIPSHRSHRVTWTANGQPTVWLAVHFS